MSRPTIYQDVLVTHLVLKTDGSKKSSPLSRHMNVSLQSDQPKMKDMSWAHRKARYVLPKNGVPIIAGPDVIEKFTAMARMKKLSFFSL